MSSNEKKDKKPKYLGHFGFRYVTKVNGKKYEAEIGQGVISQSLLCVGCIKTRFLNSQGLGEYQVTCKAHALLKAKHRADDSTGSIAKHMVSTIFTNPQVRTPRITVECNERHAVVILQRKIILVS